MVMNVVEQLSRGPHVINLHYHPTVEDDAEDAVD